MVRPTAISPTYRAHYRTADRRRKYGRTRSARRRIFPFLFSIPRHEAGCDIRPGIGGFEDLSILGRMENGQKCRRPSTVSQIRCLSRRAS
jgi:hypothetical protein